MSLLEILILIAKCLILFVFGTTLFDVIHWILHKFEYSRFALLRFLGSLHAIHHDFLDRNMKLQRKYRWGNILHHVIPETVTGIVGVALLGFVFGWLPAAIVIGIRLVMFVGYIWQLGEDITHREKNRIAAHRSLIWVGPEYHALHHVYVNQHYSSFVAVFDLTFGTNCQIRDRRFLIAGVSELGKQLQEKLEKRGAIVTQLSEAGSIESQLSGAEVMVLADQVNPGIVERFRAIGASRLVPPEVWGFGEFNARARELYAAKDLTYRHARNNPGRALFFISRGFRIV